MRTIANNSTQALAGVIIAFALAFFSACDENVDYALPADGNIAFANFVNAGEAFLYGVSDTLYRNNMLFVNDSVNNPPFDNYNGKFLQPMTFPYEQERDMVRQYPTMVSGGGFYPTTNDGDVFWMPIHTGDYRFIFTSRDKVFLKIASTTLTRGSYTIYYLVESTETDSSYAVVETRIQHKPRQEGKVSIYILNLSPDFGPVQANRADADGNQLPADLPAALPFGQMAYAEFATTDANSTNNNIMLYFSHPDKGQKLVASVVPAANGAVYLIVFKGFEQEAARKIKKSNMADATVDVQPNLRAYVQRVFY